MPDRMVEKRLETLEAQVQGLAEVVHEHLYGLTPAHRLHWGLSDEDPEPQWFELYDWKLDPSHPLHAKAVGDA